MSVDRGWMPTKKWVASLAGAAASIVASWIISGNFDDVERGMCATAVVGLVAAYFKSNDPTPGGVPNAKPSTARVSSETGQGYVEMIVGVLLVLILVVVLLRLL